MRLLHLPLLAVVFLPSIVSASESFVTSGTLYVSPENSAERQQQAEQQEQSLSVEERQDGPNDQDMVQPPENLQQYLIDQQNYNPQQQMSNEQQKAYGAAMANYNAVLRDKNIDPNTVRATYPEPQGSFPPKPGSAYYDPNADYSPENYIPNTK